MFFEGGGGTLSEERFPLPLHPLPLPRLSTLSNPCSRERELPYCGSLSESGKSIGSPRHFIIIIIIFFFFFFFFIFFFFFFFFFFFRAD